MYTSSHLLQKLAAKKSRQYYLFFWHDIETSCTSFNSGRIFEILIALELPELVWQYCPYQLLQRFGHSPCNEGFELSGVAWQGWVESRVLSLAPANSGQSPQVPEWSCTQLHSLLMLVLLYSFGRSRLYSRIVGISIFSRNIFGDKDSLLIWWKNSSGNVFLSDRSASFFTLLDIYHFPLSSNHFKVEIVKSRYTNMYYSLYVARSQILNS